MIPVDNCVVLKCELPPAAGRRGVPPRAAPARPGAHLSPAALRGSSAAAAAAAVAGRSRPPKGAQFSAAGTY